MSGSFPDNPAHGTIFELKSGLYYTFDGTTKTWVRSEGPRDVPNATARSSGLMSTKDFKKLNRLVLPPMETSLQSEDCSSAFTEGVIGFRGDDYVEVSGEATVDGAQVPREMHLHTNAIDFGLDINNLVDYMLDEGKLVAKAPTGEKGETGSTGESGLNDLPFGPDGSPGNPGTNAGQSVTLTTEAIPLELRNGTTKAVTNIAVETVSEKENYLVVTRKNIGNPNASPDKVKIQSGDSPWILVVPENAATGLKASGTCTPSDNVLYYLDVGPITESIRDKFHTETSRVKNGFEGIVGFWLSSMSDLFDEQKAALCCALENCRSRYRNQDARRYIESSRISGAQADFRVLVDADPNSCDRHVVQMTDSEACDPPSSPGENPTTCNDADGFTAYATADQPKVMPITTTNFTRPLLKIESEAAYDISFASDNHNGSMVITKDDQKSVAKFTSDVEPGNYWLAITNISKSQDRLRITGSNMLFGSGRGDNWDDAALQGHVLDSSEGPAPGKTWWVGVEITEAPVDDTDVNLSVDAKINTGNYKQAATMNLSAGKYIIEIVDTDAEIADKYTGHIAIRHTAPHGEQVIQFPNHGPQDSLIDARMAYKGLSIELDHAGGKIEAYIPTTIPHAGDGRVLLRFVRDELYFAQPQEASQRILHADAANICWMQHHHIRWYETSWISKECCGCTIKIAGQEYIIITRSIGTDTTCGGGENSNEPCIQKFAHPAIAWPTFDGKTFVSIPTTGSAIFKNDVKLSAKAVNMIRIRQASNVVGNVEDISVILFPTS